MTFLSVLGRVATSAIRCQAVRQTGNVANGASRRYAGGITATDRRLQRQAKVWKIWAGVGAGLGATAIGTIFFLGAPEEEDTSKKGLYPEDPLPLQYVYRAMDNLNQSKQKMFEWDDKLRLPPRDPNQMYKNDYVLVIDVEKTLIYTEWKPEVGFRTMKRPGVDYFLEWALQSFGEVVLWSEKDVSDAQGVNQKLLRTQLRKIGPDGLPNENGELGFPYPMVAPIELFKGHCRPMDDEIGGLAKDLVILNRDLAKVIVLDDNANSIRCCADNGIRITPWEGDSNDVSLMHSLGLLQAMVNSNMDVRQQCPRYASEEDAGFVFDQVNRARAAQQQQQLANDTPAPATTKPNAAASDGWSVMGIRIY